MPVHAEDVPYFQTGKSAVETWIERTKKEIASVGGKLQGEMFGYDHATGQASFLLQFQIGDDVFKLIWPVLPCRKPVNERAAKIQAATALYHDVKAKVVAAKFKGTRTAFFEYLVLPNDQTTAQAATADFLDLVPRLMLKG